METRQFNVTGMSCAACSSRVEKAVCALRGVSAAEVNLLTNSLKATFDEGVLGVEDIERAVEDAGYGASEKGFAGRGRTAAATAPEADAEAAAEAVRVRLIWSFALLAPLMWLSMGPMAGLPVPVMLTGAKGAPMMAFTQFLLTLPIVLLNRRYFTGGLRALVNRAPNMDSLIAVGSGTALLFGVYVIYRLLAAQAAGDEAALHHFAHSLYFEGAATIVTLISLGKFFEARAKRRTTEAVTALMKLAPPTALVVRDGAEVRIGTDEVASGDIVVVKTGETVPVDGVILEGTALLNESALTGESLPVTRGPGEAVTGATLLAAGAFPLRSGREAAAAPAPEAGVDDVLTDLLVRHLEQGPLEAGVAALGDVLLDVLGVAGAAVLQHHPVLLLIERNVLLPGIGHAVQTVHQAVDDLAAQNGLFQDLVAVLGLDVNVHHTHRLDVHQRPHLAEAVAAAHLDVQALLLVRVVLQPHIDLQPARFTLGLEIVVNLHCAAGNAAGARADENGRHLAALRKIMLRLRAQGAEFFSIQLVHACTPSFLRMESSSSIACSGSILACTSPSTVITGANPQAPRHATVSSVKRPSSEVFFFPCSPRYS